MGIFSKYTGSAMADGTKQSIPSVEANRIFTASLGCFWTPQKLFIKAFEGKGVNREDVIVGYTGGHTSSPTYRDVCSESTGHAESVQIVFDPAQLKYEELVKFFFRVHDPTQANGQGPDLGASYRSVLWYHTPEQKEACEKIKDEVQKRFFPNKRVATEILPAGPFWTAEEYHQMYSFTHPNGYSCPTHFVRNWPDF